MSKKSVKPKSSWRITDRTAFVQEALKAVRLRQKADGLPQYWQNYTQWNLSVAYPLYELHVRLFEGTLSRDTLKAFLDWVERHVTIRTVVVSCNNTINLHALGLSGVHKLYDAKLRSVAGRLYRAVRARAETPKKCHAVVALFVELVCVSLDLEFLLSSLF